MKKNSRKKYYITISIFLILMVLTFLMWLFHGGVPQSEVIIEENVQKVINVSDSNSLIRFDEMQNQSSNKNPQKIPLKNIEEHVAVNQKTPIHIISINEADLPFEEKQILIEKFQNLHKHGSLSAGKITHEFKYTNSYRQELDKVGGYAEIEKQLSFKPTPLDPYIASSLKMIGAMSSGTYTENKGFNSVLRSYESVDSKKLEINEMYLNPENNISIEIYKESINYYIKNYPATIERLKDVEGNSIINLSWNTKDRNYMLSAQNISELELNVLADNIISYQENLSIYSIK